MSCTVFIKDKNLKPQNIKKGVTILKVTGTLDASGGGSAVLQDKTVDSSTVSQSVLPGAGYDGLSRVTVNPYTLDSKTVNSSTSQQVVTSSANGLSSVTVEPYELDSKTVDPSTSQQTVNSSVDGLSSVTVTAVTSSIDANISAGNIKKDVTILGVTGTYEPTPVQPTLQDASVTYVSNGNYTVSASSGYDGLGMVDISVNIDTSANWIVEAKMGRLTDISGYSIAKLVGNPGGAAGLFMYSNITTLPRIQDPVDNPDAYIHFSSLRQTFYACSNLQSVDMSVGGTNDNGMLQCFSESAVRDASIDVSVLYNNVSGAFSECFCNCQELRNLYIHLGPQAHRTGYNTFFNMCGNAGNAWDNNDNTTITIEGLEQVSNGALQSAFSGMHTANSGGLTLNLPDNLSTVRGTETQQAFNAICQSSHLTGGTTPSFFGKLDYIYGNGNCGYAFAYSDVETATLGFNTCMGDNNFDGVFNGCQYLRAVTFDGSFGITGNYNFNYAFGDCNNLTSMTCTSTAGTMPFHDNTENNVAMTAPYITDVTIDNVNSDVCLLWNPSVNQASVYGILSKAVGATVQQGDYRKIEFYDGGLTVEDYQDGRIQTAYDAAVADGWTISNLTITPYS